MSEGSLTGPHPAPLATCRLARETWEIAAYHGLRRRIFCEEQRLFEEHDVDAWDEVSAPIVSVIAEPGSGGERVIGVVRVYETSQGTWYGGRLGVDPEYRRLGNVGKLLIVKAVTTAHAWGCREFFAIVQAQNVPLFRRLHWRVVKPIEAHGLPHAMMVADLAHYPPSTDADVIYRPKGSCHDAA
jgi:putative N-acetyltransferase (TIGR04045 family)